MPLVKIKNFCKFLLITFVFDLFVFRDIVQQCKNDEGLVDPEVIIKEMENSPHENIKQNAGGVRKKLKNFLPNDKNEQKHVLEETLLINTLKGGMQDAIDKAKSPRNSLKT